MRPQPPTAPCDDERVPLAFRSWFPHPFNPMQLEVAEVVLGTDRNVALGAPTGAGKTAVMEMARAGLFGGEGDVKAVYVAPTRALVAERRQDWARKCAPLRVQEWTGDSTAEDFAGLVQADIIVTTPEKWAAMTLKWKEASRVTNSIRLLLVVEVHLLGDPTRGATLETVLCRMRALPAVRIVVVSATVPNLRDFGDWLGAQVCAFDDSYRAVPLSTHVKAFPAVGNPFVFEKRLDQHLPGILARFNPDRVRREMQPHAFSSAPMRHRKHDPLPHFIRSRCEPVRPKWLQWLPRGRPIGTRSTQP